MSLGYSEKVSKESNEELFQVDFWEGYQYYYYCWIKKVGNKIKLYINYQLKEV
jgi:hypothetical protein